MERGGGMRARIVERRRKKITLVSHTLSSLPTGGIACFHIRVIVRQSDPIW